MGAIYDPVVHVCDVLSIDNVVAARSKVLHDEIKLRVGFGMTEM
jgi:hypothetical protein